MLIVGLTGNMASGKSTVAGMFRRLGAKIVDVDKIGHEILKKEKAVQKQLLSSLGKEILNRGSINRKKLGKIAFTNLKNVKRLNRIIHPFLIRVLKEKISQYRKIDKEEIIIIDGALLLELKGISELLDGLILVKIDQTVQMQRLKKSKPWIGKSEIKQRLESQLSQKEKIKLADCFIDNSRKIQETEKQVERIWQKLKYMASHRTALSVGKLEVDSQRRL